MSNTYVTVQGDTWDMISHKLFGSTSHTSALIRANMALIDYFSFPAGIIITVPEISSGTVSSLLPPWKAAK